MALIKYNSDFTPRTFSQLVDKLFQDFAAENRLLQFTPEVDYAETDTAYELHVSVPGLKKEDFRIEVDSDSLIIEGERKFVNEEKGKTFHTVESRYGSFRRVFQLPDNIKADKIDAKYVNGILEVVIPKDETKKLKSTITVK